MTTLNRFESGEIGALARIITHIENRESGYRQLLARLYRRSNKAIRIGLTGPPGAGKSTLVDRLSHSLLQRGQSVSVVAVDPSSPFTGGALLGDRVRYRETPDGGLHYFRSMATRGSRGGLAEATDNVAQVLGAFGFDYVLIETVGVGQVELDIVDNCDLVLVVLVPESGDAVQTLKAGLTEIADIFVVNKADRPGAERMETNLLSMLALRPGQAESPIPVILTDAVREKNIDLLIESIDSVLERLKDSSVLQERRQSQLRKKLRRLLQQRFMAETQERLTDSGAIDRAVASILAGDDDPYSAADRLYTAASL